MTKKHERRHSGLPKPEAQAPVQLPLRGGDISPAEIQQLDDDFVAAAWPEPSNEVGKCLDDIEALAGAIYARHGLPSVAGNYQRVDDRWVLIEGPRDRALGPLIHIWSIGFAQRENREVQEAAELFKLAYYSRCDLVDQRSLIGFLKGFNLAYLAGRWRQDWQLAEELRRGMSSVLGNVKYAAENEATRQKTEERDAEIRKVAKGMREINPGWSMRETAKKIADSGQFKIKLETIRTILKKSWVTLSG